jgi:predicted DCC family thiol-disulfide oxidoreductase YuxK
MIIFYDGNCPLCNHEMQLLKKHDKNNQINLEDLNAADFVNRYPEINVQHAMSILHAKTESGHMIYGLDVTVQAWARTDKYRLFNFPILNLLRWPIIGFFADKAYLFFAKHRTKISHWLGPTVCSQKDQCDPVTKADKSRH